MTSVSRTVVPHDCYIITTEAMPGLATFFRFLQAGIYKPRPDVPPERTSPESCISIGFPDDGYEVRIQLTGKPSFRNCTYRELETICRCKV